MVVTQLCSNQSGHKLSVKLSKKHKQGTVYSCKLSIHQLCFIQRHQVLLASVIVNTLISSSQALEELNYAATWSSTRSDFLVGPGGPWPTQIVAINIYIASQLAMENVAINLASYSYTCSHICLIIAKTQIFSWFDSIKHSAHNVNSRFCDHAH